MQIPLLKMKNRKDQRQLIHLVHVGVIHCPLHAWKGRGHEPVLDAPWDRAHTSVILRLTQAGHSDLGQPSHNEILLFWDPNIIGYDHHSWFMIWLNLCRILSVWLVYRSWELQIGLGGFHDIGAAPLLRETFGRGRVSSRGRQKLYKEDVASGKLLRELWVMFKYRPEESQVCRDITCLNPQSLAFYPSRWLGHHWTLGKQLGKPIFFSSSVIFRTSFKFSTSVSPSIKWN